MIRIWTLAMLVWGCGLLAMVRGQTLTEPVRCAVCGVWIEEGTVFSIVDRVDGLKKYVCTACDQITQRCALCQLPVKADFVTVGDGRFLCARDAKSAILDQQEARRACEEARVEMARAFSRFTSFPGTNVDLTIQDQLHMDMVLQSPGFDRQCPFLNGYTVSQKLNDNHWHHRIGILGGMPRARLMAVTAHELAHAWMREHLPEGRRMLQISAEGYCELIAYRLMDYLGDSAEKKHILANNYTQGQVQLFVLADHDYDFNRVMDWIRYGEDLQLFAMDPDRVRRLNPALQAQAVIASGRPKDGLPEFSLEPAPVPGQLVLNGVLGTGKKRLAVINDCTLSEGESGRVRLKDGPVNVRCVEIRGDTVRVEVEGEGAPRELALKGRQTTP